MKKVSIVNDLIEYFEKKGYEVEEVDPLTGEMTIVVGDDSFIVSVT